MEPDVQHLAEGDFGFCKVVHFETNLFQLTECEARCKEIRQVRAYALQVGSNDIHGVQHRCWKAAVQKFRISERLTQFVFWVSCFPRHRVRCTAGVPEHGVFANVPEKFPCTIHLPCSCDVPSFGSQHIELLGNPTLKARQDPELLVLAARIGRHYVGIAQDVVGLVGRSGRPELLQCQLESGRNLCRTHGYKGVPPSAPTATDDAVPRDGRHG